MILSLLIIASCIYLFFWLMAHGTPPNNDVGKWFRWMKSNKPDDLEELLRSRAEHRE